MFQPTEILLNSRQFKKLYDMQVKNIAERYHLTPNEINILLFLANNPDYDTAKEIAALRLLPKSCVSKSVDSLTRQGFLSSREDSKDRRILHLSILPAAGPLVADAQRTQEQFLACMYKDFTPEEREMLNYLTAKISKNIKEALHQ